MSWISLMIGIVMIGNHHANKEISGLFFVAFLPLLYCYSIKIISKNLKNLQRIIKLTTIFYFFKLGI